jgi:uncharacterized protein (DUF3820 family)
MIYLATPYSHEDPLVREDRFRVVTKAAADLMQFGLLVYSPITHGHLLAQSGGLPKTWEYWKEHNSKMMLVCTHLVVLNIPGFKESIGVAMEIKLAEGRGLSTLIIQPGPGFASKVKQWVTPVVAGLKDMDRMPYGKHMGKLMQDVPASYLHWLWSNGLKEKADSDPVGKYIKNNLGALKIEHRDGIW